MKTAIYKGASKTLYRGCRYVFPGEEVDMSAEELSSRLKVTPGLWEEVKTATKAEPTAAPVRVDPTVGKTVGKKVTKV